MTASPSHPALRFALLLALAGSPAAPAAERIGRTEPAEFSGILAAHNAPRRAVGVPPLTWSDAAATQAQGWADQLARENCALRYNPDPARRETFGENILRGTSAQPYAGFKRTPAGVVHRWAEEAAWYDPAGNACNAPPGKICGSYLQMVWETTEVVGCGRARCDTGEVWVCNYTPRGLQEGLRPWGNPPPPPPPAPAPLACYAQEPVTQVPTGDEPWSD